MISVSRELKTYMEMATRKKLKLGISILSNFSSFFGIVKESGILLVSSNA